MVPGRHGTAAVGSQERKIPVGKSRRFAGLGVATQPAIPLGDVESVPMPFRDIQRIALTLTIGSAIFLGPALDVVHAAE